MGANLDILHLGLMRDQGQSLLHHRQKVQRGLALVGGGMGKAQEVLDDGAGFADSAMHLLGALPAEFRGEIALGEELGGRGGDGQRGANLVGDAPGHHAEGG